MASSPALRPAASKMGIDTDESASLILHFKCVCEGICIVEVTLSSCYCWSTYTANDSVVWPRSIFSLNPHTLPPHTFIKMQLCSWSQTRTHTHVSPRLLALLINALLMGQSWPQNPAADNQFLPIGQNDCPIYLPVKPTPKRLVSKTGDTLESLELNTRHGAEPETHTHTITYVLRKHKPDTCMLSWYLPSHSLWFVNFGAGWPKLNSNIHLIGQ